MESRDPTPTRPRAAPRRSSGRPPAVPATADRTTGEDPATIRDLYDTALARETAVGESPLERYQSVLLATPGSA